MEQSETGNEEGINLLKIIKTLWEEKVFLISLTTLFAIFSVIYALMLTNLYKSESILQARDSQDASMFSQFSGLASMAGLSLPGAANDSSTEIIEIIRSREFVKHLTKFEEVLPSLLAAKSYDQVSQKIIYDSESYNSLENVWLENKENINTIPTYLDAHIEYSKIVSVSKDLKTGLISISVSHISPVFAKEFLDLIINEANSLKRDKDILTSEKAIKYLQEQLAVTPQASIKGSINSLIEAQLKTRMMANIHEDYALIAIEPPFIPERRYYPVRSLIAIFGTLFGLAIGIIVVLIRKNEQH